ncbi:MAG TPA: DUF4124 domain-containing protein [Steroidobacteraceae bacterium]|jgi:opacity protein-like surface antigen
MLRILCLAVLVTGAAGAVYASDVYRYVDADGGVHYSDTWVPGATLIHVEHGKSTEAPPARTTPSAQPKAVAQAGANASADLQKQANAQAMQAEMSQAQGDQCAKATDAYNQAIRTRRIYKPQSDGGRDYLSEDEANAYRLQLRDAMQQACGSATK